MFAQSYLVIDPGKAMMVDDLSMVHGVSESVNVTQKEQRQHNKFPVLCLDVPLQRIRYMPCSRIHQKWSFQQEIGSDASITDIAVCACVTSQTHHNRTRTNVSTTYFTISAS